MSACCSACTSKLRIAHITSTPRPTRRLITMHCRYCPLIASTPGYMALCAAPCDTGTVRGQQMRHVSPGMLTVLYVLVRCSYLSVCRRLLRSWPRQIVPIRQMPQPVDIRHELFEIIPLCPAPRVSQRHRPIPTAAVVRVHHCVIVVRSNLVRRGGPNASVCGKHHRRPVPFGAV
jgi:hypothetical protein